LHNHTLNPNKLHPPHHPPPPNQAAPWSKTGGLGDVVGSLPIALAARGHRVMVVVPRYADYEDTEETGVRRRCGLPRGVWGWG